jgi:hypothetical protein
VSLAGISGLNGGTCTAVSAGISHQGSRLDAKAARCGKSAESSSSERSERPISFARQARRRNPASPGEAAHSWFCPHSHSFLWRTSYGRQRARRHRQPTVGKDSDRATRRLRHSRARRGMCRVPRRRQENDSASAGERPPAPQRTRRRIAAPADRSRPRTSHQGAAKAVVNRRRRRDGSQRAWRVHRAHGSRPGRRYRRLWRYIQNGKLAARFPPVKRMTRSASWHSSLGGRDGWSGFCANAARRTVGLPSPWHQANTRRSGTTAITVSLLSGTAAKTNGS